MSTPVVLGRELPAWSSAFTLSLEMVSWEIRFIFVFSHNVFRSVAGKEQLVIAAMAKALEIIPRQLCDNAGFDATNILNKLRQKHAQVVELWSSRILLFDDKEFNCGAVRGSSARAGNLVGSRPVGVFKWELFSEITIVSSSCNSINCSSRIDSSKIHL